jgi:hypothetical protein
VGLFALRPGDLLTILKMALSIGFRSSVSFPPAIQATGFLTFSPVGFFFLPLNMPAFAGRTFLLFCVHRDDWHPFRQRLLHLGADMTELRIAVRMIRAFLGLPVALQAVVLVAEKLSHLLMTDRMLPSSQLSGQSPGALADPAQGIFRIAPRFRFNETIQRDQ